MAVKMTATLPTLKMPFEWPLNPLAKTLLLQREKIESWFKAHWQNKPLLFTSVDLRNSSFKIAAIDTNVFPAGFNNLHPGLYPYAIDAIKATLSESYPQYKNILLIPESHTRNPHYYQSVAILAKLLEKSGYPVKIGSLLAQETDLIVETPNHGELILHSLYRSGKKISCEKVEPCLVVLNNDLSDGIPSLLLEIEQPIEPPLQMGWFTRSKNTHFHHYQQICQEFADFLAIDVWQITSLFTQCQGVDFLRKEGLDCLIPKVEKLLAEIQKKYDEYHIKEKPFIVIKADAGTYGMAVMSVQDPSDLVNINRKQRSNMSSRKGGQIVDRVILQEGIRTCEQFLQNGQRVVAEPVVYMAGHYPIGAFYRMNRNRNAIENLNTKGMHFEKIPPASEQELNLESNHLFYAYSVIARLAFLAACQEKEQLLK